MVEQQTKASIRQLPRDAFWGSGAGHQVVLVIPRLNLIAVRNGASLGEAMEHHDMLNAVLFEPLVAASDPRRPGCLPIRRARSFAQLTWAPPADDSPRSARQRQLAADVGRRRRLVWRLRRRPGLRADGAEETQHGVRAHHRRAG